MKDIIEALYPMNATLLGEGYDSRIEFLKHLIDLEIIEVPTGTQVGTWTVPEEWVIRDAWLKFNGKKIIDFQKEPLSVVTYSKPFKGKVEINELYKHLFTQIDSPDSTPYTFKFYDRDWGFSVPHNLIRNLDGTPKLKDGDYEVCIDAEFKPGKMKLAIHTIPGKSKREILLFAHLDHPYQANDNLSGVACLVDLARKIKSDYTIKIVLCPETIGSIAYAHTQDISKVDFVLAIDICGNDNALMMNKTFDVENRLNKVVHCAFRSIGEGHRKAPFRGQIGSDETVFNDPLIGIPGVMLSTYPYREYHTADDTPDKINYEKITETQNVILKTIEIWEKDFIPKKLFKGPLMRSKYGVQSTSKQQNLCLDYLFYSINGKKSVAELCAEFELTFETVLEIINKLIHDGYVERIDFSKERKQKTSGKKHA